MEALIYKTTNLIDGKIYVGSTINVENSKYFGSGIILISAIKKYGRENFKRESLEICDIAKKQERETFWINELKSYDREIGYNISRSGVGPNAPHTTERKERIRLANTGKKRTLEQKKHISEGKKGKKFSKDHCDNLGKSKIGKKWSPDQKKLLSEKRKGKKIQHPRTGPKINYFMSKREMFRIVQYSLNGEFIKEWENLLEIKLNTDWRISYIEDAINGVRKTAYKFNWKRI